MRVGVLAMVVSVALTPATANAQAFGIRIGNNISNYKVVSRSRNFYVVSPPIPHEKLESYFALTAPDGEICSVSGAGQTITNDLSGARSRDEYGYWAQALIRKYGKPSTNHDFITPDSTFAQKNDFRRAVQDKVRTLSAFWFSKDGALLTSDLSSIWLDMKAFDSGTFISLTYEGRNFINCRERSLDDRDAGL